MELGLKPGSDAKVPPLVTGFISLLDIWRLLLSLPEGTFRSYSNLVSETFSPNIF